MADPTGIQDGSVFDMTDIQPIATRRKRRGSASSNAQRSLQDEGRGVSRRAYGISTPPSTPHRTKKRVRFSEPSPSTTTGLTPFLFRNSISSPPSSRSRRHSTPSSRWNLHVDDSPIICGELQFQPFRQVLSGRVKRRISRRGLSEEFNTIETEEKHKKRNREADFESLIEELRKKDQEIEDMKQERDIHSQIGGEAGTLLLENPQTEEKIKSLELEIVTLRAQIRNYELDAAMPGEAGLPVAVQTQYDDDAFSPNYSDGFNSEMTDVFVSTPGRRSFPSPPATVPNTPSKPPAEQDIPNNASSVEAERAHLESQLRILQEELKDLSKRLELRNTTHERLTAKLAPFVCDSIESEKDGNLDAALDSVLTQLALSESTALDNSARFSAMSTELKGLFPSPQFKDPESILQQLHSQFRAARLELEYLTPGENPEGFENCKLLDMLLSRLRVLTKKVEQQDADIDQYHSQEMSLRQQLGSRVDAMTQLQETLTAAISNVSRLESDVQERDEGISKLTHALQGYRDEVSGLETLINRLEVEHAADTASLRDEVERAEQGGNSKVLDLELKIETLDAVAGGREILMHELEKRLTGAVVSARALEDELNALRDENDVFRKTVQEREEEVENAFTLREENNILRKTAREREIKHGKALALRDARVTEFKGELETVNEALKRAYEKITELTRENRSLRQQAEEKIMELTRENQSLTSQVEADKLKWRDSAIAIEGLWEMAKPTLADMRSDDSTPDTTSVCLVEGASSVIGQSTPAAIVNPGPGLLFNASLARRRSTSLGMDKKRRRYDSNLGFLEEQDEVL